MLQDYDKQLICSMYQNNIGINKIAKIFKITTLEVQEILYKNNLSIMDYKFLKRDKKICNEYSNGTPVIKLADKYKIDRHTVVDILKRNNLYINRFAKNNSKEKEKRNKEIIRLYSEGCSLREVSKICHVCPRTVSVVLNEFNIELRPQHQKGHSKGVSKNKKYKYNDYFFNKIDTQEKAYWLGFLYADGYVNYEGRIALALQESDIDHLKKFTKAIGDSDIKLHYSKKTKSYAVGISNIKMGKDLTDKGCFQKKSLKLKFPNTKQVPEKYIRHFIRGYFDGDGCIYIPKKNKGSSTFSLIGTFDFLNGIKKEFEKLNLQKSLKLSHNKSHNENTYFISISNMSDLQKIYKYLYNYSNVFLDRKKDKFITAVQKKKS